MGGTHERVRARETSSPTGKGSDSAGLNHFHADCNHLELNSSDLKMDWGNTKQNAGKKAQKKKKPCGGTTAVFDCKLFLTVK